MKPPRRTVSLMSVKLGRKGSHGSFISVNQKGSKSPVDFDRESGRVLILSVLN